MNKQSPDIDKKISYGLKNRDKLPRVAKGNKKTDDKLVFSEINGERRQVRRVLTKKGDKELKVSLIYDYVSK